MTRLGNDAFVAAMKQAHPSKTHTPNIVEPVIPVQIMSETGNKCPKSAYTRLFHRDILHVGVTPFETAQEKYSAKQGVQMSMTDTIIKVVSYVGKVSVSELKGIDRHKEMVRWRHLCWFLIDKHVPVATLPFIGKRFGRHHTTILHGLRKVRGDYDHYEADIKKLESFV